MGVLDVLKEAMYYETIKLVTVKNWKLGLINRAIQALVIVYIVVFAIWYKKGYQAQSKVNGIVYTKVKGLARDQYQTVYDSGDLVIPATENDALFIATRALVTVQKQNSTCVDPDPTNNCTTDSDCKVGKQTSNGYVQPICNITVNRCLVTAWCPVEDESLPFAEFNGVLNWTIFIRTNVEYSDFAVSANNADKTVLGYNIFSMAEMLKEQNLTDIVTRGAIINAMLDWTCNLDTVGNGANCRPVFRYLRVDGGSASGGFNFREAVYFGMNATSERIYTKWYGVRFLFHIIGSGGRFDVFTCLITVGSAIAFFGIAGIITDFILQYLHPRKEMFDEAKRDKVDLGKEDEHAGLLTV